MSNMLIFGLGYTASRLADRMRAAGWMVTGTRREAAQGAIAFDDRPAVEQAIMNATHIISSVPPDEETGDPVLTHYQDHIAACSTRWIGYLSSTGVYGDAHGAWVDESAPVGTGRRKARSNADQNWLQLTDNVRVFRLPGIYGPGRSPLDRLRKRNAKRIDAKGQVFSRIHVDDIVSAIIAAFDGPTGAYNISDDLPAPNQEVIAHAARLLGMEIPPLLSLDEANLSATAMGFYSESRRIANGKAKRLLGWEPKYADYKIGLASLLDN